MNEYRLTACFQFLSALCKSHKWLIARLVEKSTWLTFPCFFFHFDREIPRYRCILVLVFLLVALLKWWVQISVNFVIHIWLKLSHKLLTVALLFNGKKAPLKIFANLMIEKTGNIGQSNHDHRLSRVVYYTH